MNNKDIIKEIEQASDANDVEKIKLGLHKLNLIKKPNVLTDMFGNFKYLGNFVIDKIKSNEENKFLFDSLLCMAGEHNNIELCKYLVESKELRVHSNINDLFIWKQAVRENCFDMLQYMVHCPKVENSAKMIVGALIHTPTVPRNEILEYLINTPSEPHYEEVNKFLSKISSDSDTYYARIFKNFCSQNSKDGVDFLLAFDNRKELMRSSDFKEATRVACRMGHIELVQYLLTHETMPYKPYVDYDPKKLLIDANRTNSWEMLKFLIIDFRIPRPNDLSILLNDVHKKGAEDVLEFFKKRELYDSLTNELEVTCESNTSNASKKRKL